MQNFRSTRWTGRVVGWIAAYALVLHAVLAGMVATQAAATRTSNPHFELCLTDTDSNGAPGQQRHHEACAVHCLALGNGALPAIALILLALLFPRSAGQRIAPAFVASRHDLLRRAGLGSRAPPLPA